MNLRNDEPFGLVGFPPEVRRMPPKPGYTSTNRFGRKRPLGVVFEECAELFERCSEAHNHCEDCPARSDGCMTLWDRVVCERSATGQLSCRQFPVIQKKLQELAPPMSGQPRKSPERQR